ncbi:DUF3298 and DUF4163 domain-containing protein [Echinicola sp. CAU 1574]|uniref:DUF3298 and DUF4163 domain-containing protein n=1 Tax=Echinicola arenosa TaxID=2774144 RepID=A0ABR9AS54_9BACT|nr:DUF3298 and DUF4163 domain-containing protein [Echinicola arenosa]MBD8491196.1 DUF3298 and DUF4163 domain-containing protein [Echinicola arenosa]
MIIAVMNVEKIPFLLGFTLLFFGVMACSSGQEKKIHVLEQASLRYEIDDFSQNACVGEDSVCAEVNMFYPIFENGDEGLTSWINLHIKEQLLMYLTWGEEEIQVDSLEAGAEKFLDGFVDFGRDYPESVHSWFNNTESEVSMLDDGTLSIFFSNSSFTGGAHPNHSVMFLNFDLINKKLLKEEDLVLDKQELLELSEKKFKEYHDVEVEINLKDDGRFFLDENEQFFLPAAIGYEGEDFVMIYNSYEIGPYAMGQTELRFSLEELEGIVRPIKKGN